MTRETTVRWATARRKVPVWPPETRKPSARPGRPGASPVIAVSQRQVTVPRAANETSNQGPRTVARLADACGAATSSTPRRLEATNLRNELPTLEGPSRVRRNSLRRRSLQIGIFVVYSDARFGSTTQAFLAEWLKATKPSRRRPISSQVRPGPGPPRSCRATTRNDRRSAGADRFATHEDLFLPDVVSSRPRRAPLHRESRSYRN
jgi:hypothetical protein